MFQLLSVYVNFCKLRWHRPKASVEDFAVDRWMLGSNLNKDERIELFVFSDKMNKHAENRKQGSHSPKSG
jgi:hypothetical protein